MSIYDSYNKELSFDERLDLIKKNCPDCGMFLLCGGLVFVPVDYLDGEDEIYHYKFCCKCRVWHLIDIPERVLYRQPELMGLMIQEKYSDKEFRQLPNSHILYGQK